MHLRSRNDNDFNSRYPSVVRAPDSLPDETVIDGEVVALDDQGRPDFNILQNLGSSLAPLVFYVFDVMMLAGTNVMKEPLDVRRHLLEHEILPKLHEPIRYLPEMRASLPDLIDAVKAQGLEGTGQLARFITHSTSNQLTTHIFEGASFSWMTHS